MKQEELKVALCGYLPYEVKMVNKEIHKTYCNPLTLIGVTNNGIYLNGLGLSQNLNNHSPILYNISTLTKPIIVKGYNGGLPFVPIEEMLDLKGHDLRFKELSCGIVVYENVGNGNYEPINSISIDDLKLSHAEKLNRMMVDYRNLIGQGLAIDVETLKENCYEN